MGRRITEVKFLKTAIIVLNYNDYDNTSHYVKEIEKYQAIDKIIIVDNHSTKENEVEKLQHLQNNKIELVIAEKNGGYAYGNNVGLTYLDQTYGKDSFPYIIVSNPDVSVEEEAILKTISFLEQHPQAAIAAPRMCFKQGPARRSAWKFRKFAIDVANSTRITELLLYPFLRKGEYSKQDFAKEILQVDVIAGSFFIAKRTIFREIGYFDTNTFLFFEEDIVAEKIKEKGYQIYSLNFLQFIHYDSQCIGKLFNMFKKQDILFDSRMYYHKKYHHIGKGKQFILLILRYLRKVELWIEVPIRKLLRR